MKESTIAAVHSGTWATLSVLTIGILGDYLYSEYAGSEPLYPLTQNINPNNAVMSGIIATGGLVKALLDYREYKSLKSQGK